jgi:quercetin dioxygenase-like cupin family protein
MKIVRHQDIAGAELRSAETFTGQAWGNVLHEPEELPGTRVTLVVFSPGARSWWHSHDEGQVIYAVSGLGLIATKEPGSARQIRAGDTVIVPPHEPHWHGAMRNSFLLHLTVNTGNYHHTHWLGEEVSADEYEAAHG